MPKLEPKIVQKELDSGQIWPFYWLFGSETMKSRELMKRIRKTALARPDESAPSDFFGGSFNELTLEGAEITGPELVDHAHSLSLGGGTRVIVVRDAHLMKEAEACEAILGPKGKAGELSAVVVCFSKDLDQRKKFSKILMDKGACVPCEEIADPDREAWIQYLARRRGVALQAEMVALLRAMDPWSLDLIDRELEKLEVAGQDSSVLIGGTGEEGAEERYLESFFERDPSALGELIAFAETPDRSLPLLGLMAWNARMLAQYLKEQETGTRDLKLNPYVAERFQRYRGRWSVAEVVELQHRLQGIDFSLKQTARVPLGIWTELTLHFVRKP